MVSVPDINYHDPLIDLTMKKGKSYRGSAEIIFTYITNGKREQTIYWIDEETHYVEAAREFLIDTWIQEMFPIMHAMLVGDYKKVQRLMVKM